MSCPVWIPSNISNQFHTLPMGFIFAEAATMKENQNQWTLAPQVVPQPQRGRVRALLVATALGTIAATEGCGPQIYGNPKGCRYDDAGVQKCFGDQSIDGGTDGGTNDGGQ
jgi:hypothetical protein